MRSTHFDGDISAIRGRQFRETLPCAIAEIVLKAFLATSGALSAILRQVISCGSSKIK